MPYQFTFPNRNLTIEAIVFWRDRLHKLLLNRKVALTILYDDSYGRMPEVLTDTIKKVHENSNAEFSITTDNFVYCQCIPVYLSIEWTLHTITYADAGGAQLRIWKIKPPTLDEVTREERDKWIELWYDSVDSQR